MSDFPLPGARFAIYARYSTALQNFKSIDDQIRICREYATRQGWVEAGTFYDAERSGTTFQGRSGFFKMMAAADRGEFEVVVTEDLDRLSRQASGTHGLVEELDFLGVTICTVNSGLVSDIEVAFKAVQNANYIKNLAAKSRRGVEGTVKKGLLTGRVPYGYRKVFTPDGKAGQREINPDQAKVIVRIMKDYAAGVSPLAICRALTAEGIPGPGGRPWRPGMIYGSKVAGTGVLRNKLYVGINEWGRTIVKRNLHKGTKAVRSVPTSDRVRVDVPELRIVDDELFESVQARLGANENPRFFVKRRPDYLLTGLCYCGVCGAKYHVLHDRLGCVSSGLQRACNNRRRVCREDLESAVLDGLKARLLRKDLIEPYVAEYRAEVERSIAERQDRLQSSELRQKELARQIGNIMTRLREGNLQGFASQVVYQELDRLEAERQQLERVAKHAPQTPPVALDTPSIVARLHTLMDDLQGVLEGDGRDAVRARELIREIVSRVVITPLIGDRTDGRGIGPVRIDVEGSLSGLLDLAGADRVIQHRSRPETLQGHASLTFKYYVDLFPLDSRLLPHGYDDFVVIGRALDDAEAPVRKRDLIDALARAEGVEPDYAPGGQLMRRAGSAVDYLLARREIRCIPARHFSGYVWNHIALTDEEWKARAAAFAARPAPMHLPLPVMRVSAPEAYVVVIGRKEEGPAA